MRRNYISIYFFSLPKLHKQRQMGSNFLLLYFYNHLPVWVGLCTNIPFVSDTRADTKRTRSNKTYRNKVKVQLVWFKNFLFVLRYGFTVISNLVVYVITWFILHINSGEENKVGPGDVSKFQHIVVTGLCLGLLCSVIFHIFVKEEGAFGTNNVRGTQLRRPIAELLRSPEVYQVIIFL